MLEQVQQLASAPLVLAEATEDDDLVEALGAAPRAPEAPAVPAPAPAPGPKRPPGAIPLPGMSPSRAAPERRPEGEGYVAPKPAALPEAKTG